MAVDNPNGPAGAPVVDPTALFQALGNSIRWDALQQLATAGPQSVNDLAERAGRAQDSMSRHMTLLYEAGAVVGVDPPDGDGRKQFYGLPPGCLRETPGGKEIDYGTCVLRLR